MVTAWIRHEAVGSTTWCTYAPRNRSTTLSNNALVECTVDGTAHLSHDRIHVPAVDCLSGGDMYLGMIEPGAWYLSATENGILHEMWIARRRPWWKGQSGGEGLS